MKRKRLGNPPLSPYHHKTEMPGVPGHHRLSGCGCLGNMSGIAKKRCFTVDKKQICEGDTIVQESNKGRIENTVKGICGGYVITEGDLGLTTQPIKPLKTRMKVAKFQIRRK